MFTQAPLRLARLAFLLGLAALAASALVVVPLHWLSVKAESSASQVASAYALRAAEPTPQPEFSPAPLDDAQLAKKAGRQATRTLVPVFVFVGAAGVCFLLEMALSPKGRLP